LHYLRTFLSFAYDEIFAASIDSTVRFPRLQSSTRLAAPLLAAAYLAACHQAPPAALPQPESPVPAAERAEEAGALIAEYSNETDASRRVEIVYQLAINGSPPAREALERTYRTAPDDDLKRHAILSLSFIDGDDLALSLALLQDALTPSQPAELRAAAVEVLRDIGSPKTLPLWRTLLTDADASLRETARETIDFLSSMQ
jgi:HEAT repeat protein